MRRTPLLATVLLPAVLSLAACSGSGTNTAGTGSPATTSPARPTSGPASAPAASKAPGAAQSAVPAEQNPPGDIPDNVAFVPYSNPAGRYAFTHPEGWSETTRTTSVTFTDKLNGVQAMTGTRTAPPTVGSAKQDDVPALQAGQAAFELRSVTAVTLPGGSGVRIVYRRNSPADPVTGRQYRDEVERYELVSGGREVVVELFGPVGADNVDAYKQMIDSLKLG